MRAEAQLAGAVARPSGRRLRQRSSGWSAVESRAQRARDVRHRSERRDALAVQPAEDLLAAVGLGAPAAARRPARPAAGAGRSASARFGQGCDGHGAEGYITTRSAGASLGCGDGWAALARPRPRRGTRGRDCTAGALSPAAAREDQAEAQQAAPAGWRPSSRRPRSCSRCRRPSGRLVRPAGSLSLSTTQVPMPSGVTLHDQQSDGQLNGLARVGLAGVGLRDARHAGAALGRRAAVGLALAGRRVAELARRAEDGRAGIGLAGAGHAAFLVRRTCPGRTGPCRRRRRSTGRPGSRRSGTCRSCSAADAELGRRAGEQRVVAVEAAARDADLRVEGR